VQTFTFDGQPEDVSLGTLRFEDLGDGRHPPARAVAGGQFRGPATSGLASGMETGVDQGYAKLDALVAELR